jgi:FKBP-type peptidyl-prolyl cis-trans isomerase
MKREQIFRSLRIISVIFLFTALIYGCKNSNDVKFQTADNGVRYKFYVHNEDSTGVKRYDIVEVIMNYRTKDTMLYNGAGRPIPFQINPVYDGDLMDGIMMMNVGDSATFVLDAEEFYKNMMNTQEVPEEIGDNKDLFFDIKLISVQSETDQMKAERLANESRRDGELPAIERFLKENHYDDVQPTESGLYYIEVKEGTGKQAVAGKKVKVHYTGTFLNGEKFDSSYDRDEPIEFTLGVGQVIRGWDEGIAMMKEGGKAKLIIPSKLGYGAQPRGSIKAYSPLFFEVELIKVED